MDRTDDTIPEDSAPGLSRRRVLGLAATLAATPLLAAPAQAGQGARLLLPTKGGIAKEDPTSPTPVRGRPRSLHAAVGLRDGRVMVIGGYGVDAAALTRAGSAPTASVQVYDPRRDVWADLPSLRLPRARHAAVLLPDDRVVVLGGYHLAPMTSVEVYDPYANAWRSGDPLPRPLMDHAASLCDGGILLTGGQTATPALLLPFPA